MESSRLQRNNPSLQGVKPSTEHSRDPLSREELKIPHIELGLILHLKAVFASHVAPDYSLRKYDQMVGHQQVLEYLERLHSEQETT